MFKFWPIFESMGEFQAVEGASSPPFINIGLLVL